MKFAIIKGKPYLINEGRAFPIKLLENGFGIVGSGKKTDVKGIYTLMELRVKINQPDDVNITPQTKKKPAKRG